MRRLRKRPDSRHRLVGDLRMEKVEGVQVRTRRQTGEVFAFERDFLKGQREDRPQIRDRLPVRHRGCPDQFHDRAPGQVLVPHQSPQPVGRPGGFDRREGDLIPPRLAPEQEFFRAGLGAIPRRVARVAHQDPHRPLDPGHPVHLPADQAADEQDQEHQTTDRQRPPAAAGLRGRGLWGFKGGHGRASGEDWSSLGRSRDADPRCDRLRGASPGRVGRGRRSRQGRRGRGAPPGRLPAG